MNFSKILIGGRHGPLDDADQPERAAVSPVPQPAETGSTFPGTSQGNRTNHPDLQFLYAANPGTQTPSASSSRAAVMPSFNGQPLYTLHDNGEAAVARLLKPAPDEVIQMCKLALDVVGRSFPARFNNVDFDFYVRGNDSPEHLPSPREPGQKYRLVWCPISTGRRTMKCSE